MDRLRDYIQVKNVSKSYENADSPLEVLKDINFNVRKGEFICIVGGSGCGKSTLLRVMSGLEPSHDGEVVIDGKIIEKPGKERGFVFQENRLFPWMTVEKNIRFVLDKGSKDEKKQKVQEVIDLVGLTGFEKSFPKELSGGMAQRANIARALVNKPSVMFLDEPFGALDAFTKMQLQEELIKVKYKDETTMIMVTHDIEEAVYLADRIIIMGKGPGVIKDIISVDLPRPRNRNSHYFVRLKKRVYDYFFEDVEINEDYNI